MKSEWVKPEVPPELVLRLTEAEAEALVEEFVKLPLSRDTKKYPQLVKLFDELYTQCDESFC